MAAFKKHSNTLQHNKEDWALVSQRQRLPCDVTSVRESKMAAAMRSSREFLTCFSCSQRLIAKRFYRYNVLNVIKKQGRMFEDDVYILCTRERPKHSFNEALKALRCFSFFMDETVTLYVKIKLGNEKVSEICAIV